MFNDECSTGVGICGRKCDPEISVLSQASLLKCLNCPLLFTHTHPHFCLSFSTKINFIILWRYSKLYHVCVIFNCIMHVLFLCTVSNRLIKFKRWLVFNVLVFNILVYYHYSAQFIFYHSKNVIFCCASFITCRMWGRRAGKWHIIKVCKRKYYIHLYLQLCYFVTYS